MKYTMIAGLAIASLSAVAQAEPATFTYAYAYASGENKQSSNGDFISSDSSRRALATQPFTNGGSAVTNSYADLTTGSLGVSAFSGPDASSGAVGVSRYGDGLTFDIAGASEDTITRIDFSATYHGGFFTDGAVNPGFAALSSSHFQLNFENIYYQSLGVYTASSLSTGTTADGSYFGYWTPSNLDGNATTNGDATTFNGYFFVKGAAQRVALTTSLSVNAYGGAFGDFGNTASIRFTLPDSVSLRSDSGTFLSAVNGAVPEPSAWALLIVGFGMVGGALRTRTQRTAQVRTSLRYA